MKCPVCGAAKLIRDTRDIPYTYKGESTMIPGVTGDFCPACGESVLDMAAATQLGDSIRAFNKQVNASIVDPKFITTVRKSYRWISAKQRKFLAVASMRFPAMRPARRSRRLHS